MNAGAFSPELSYPTTKLRSMEALNISASAELTGAICHALFELARREDELAAAEAAGVPYWAPCPPSVFGHRVAAEALRTEAESLSHVA